VADKPVVRLTARTRAVQPARRAAPAEEQLRRLVAKIFRRSRKRENRLHSWLDKTEEFAGQ
jgi:hypothetical protein